MKGQVIGDFLATYFVDNDNNFEQNNVNLEPWILYFDGLSNS